MNAFIHLCSKIAVECSCIDPSYLLPPPQFPDGIDPPQLKAYLLSQFTDDIGVHPNLELTYSTSLLTAYVHPNWEPTYYPCLLMAYMSTPTRSLPTLPVCLWHMSTPTRSLSTTLVCIWHMSTPTRNLPTPPVCLWHMSTLTWSLYLRPQFAHDICPPQLGTYTYDPSLHMAYVHPNSESTYSPVS